MSYTKTTWADDDVITAEAMNNNENGTYNANQNAEAALGGNPIIVPFTLTVTSEGGQTIIECTTTADFEDTLAAVVSGKVAIAVVNGVLGGATCVMCGVMSTLSSGNDILLGTTVLMPKSSGTNFDASVIIWKADGIDVGMKTINES